MTAREALSTAFMLEVSQRLLLRMFTEGKLVYREDTSRIVFDVASRAASLRQCRARASGGTAYAKDLKSLVPSGTCGFESRLAHSKPPNVCRKMVSAWQSFRDSIDEQIFVKTGDVAEKTTVDAIVNFACTAPWTGASVETYICGLRVTASRRQILGASELVVVIEP